ncbi:MAG: glycosyltransferase [Oceanococcus sp.]
MSMLALALSWVAISLVVYHHLGYPLLLKFMALIKPDNDTEIKACTVLDEACPSIGVLIPCYNEAAVIAQKLHNLAACDYPQNKLKIYIVCDGCTDNTADTARTAATICSDLQIEVLERTENCGKLQCLRETVPMMTEELLALSDASALVSIDAFRIAAGLFQDPQTGCISGRYQLLDSGGDGQSAYWSYQVFIKQQEDARGSTLGAHGAFYILRRDLFQAPPDGSINDDFLIPMYVIRQGYRVRYAPTIVALELEHLAERDEIRRRRRIAVGNVQMSLQLVDMLHPRYGWVAFNFLSGKVLRAWMPVILLSAVIASICSAWEYPWMIPIALLQILAYTIAAWQHFIPNWPDFKIMRVLHYIVAGHVAGARGLYDYFVRKGNFQWA